MVEGDIVARSGIDGSWLKRYFGTSLAGKRALRLIDELLVPRDGERYLLVNGADAGLAYHLCRGPGSWSAMHTNPEAAALLRGVAGGPDNYLQGDQLPLKSETVDAVVLHDVVERRSAPLELVAECHRVLKASGRLIVHVPRAKSWAMARGLERVLGLKSAAELREVTPYTASALFDLVKDGFDVEDERSYSRFFSELAEATVRFVAGYAASRVGSEPDRAALEQLCTVRGWCYPLLVAGAVLDYLLFFTAGYYLVCRGRKRIWRPRRAPVLQDGRSIADATINTKIGTAGPLAGGG